MEIQCAPAVWDLVRTGSRSEGTNRGDCADHAVCIGSGISNFNSTPARKIIPAALSVQVQIDTVALGSDGRCTLRFPRHSGLGPSILRRPREPMGRRFIRRWNLFGVGLGQ